MNSKTINSLILWNKPAGETSFQSIGKIKKALGTKKVGHTGTLDKFADGLIVALTGKLTKLNPVFTGMDKTYIAEITFGYETDTLDPEGEITAEAELPDPERVEAEINGLTGVQDQIPPMYSAVHIDGERAWKRARSGEQVKMKPRRVDIYSIEILNSSPDKVNLKVECSKGTYIRSLARDLGKVCGSRATLTALKRTKVGPFSLDQAVIPGELDKIRIESAEASGTVPVEKIYGVIGVRELVDVLPEFYTLTLDDDTAERVSNGGNLKLLFDGDEFSGRGYYALIDRTSALKAFVKSDGAAPAYMFVVPQ